MKLYVKNTLAGLVPLYASDLDQKRKLKLGETYEVDIRRPRNLAFHKKFFALINTGWENSQFDMPVDVYRKWVTMRAGFYVIYHTPKGMLYEPESISFASMDEDKFADVYSRVLDVIIEDLGCTKEEITEQIMSFL